MPTTPSNGEASGGSAGANQPGESTAVLVGAGIDLVHVPSFAEQLAVPGSRFAEVFSPAERRLVRRRAATSGAEAEHLAARWAAKEAFVKAWSVAILGSPPVIAPVDFPWAQVELLSDQWNRPRLNLTGELAGMLNTSLQRDCALAGGRAGTAHLVASVTHDGDYAQGSVHVMWCS